MSPFLLVNVPPPPPMPPYRPLGGDLGQWWLHPRIQLYLLGLGMFLAAAGLILGDSSPPVKP
jgi:hypothetical protein